MSVNEIRGFLNSIKKYIYMHVWERKQFCFLKKYLSRHFIFVHKSMRRVFSRYKIYIFQHSFLSDFINITWSEWWDSISLLYLFVSAAISSQYLNYNQFLINISYNAFMLKTRWFLKVLLWSDKLKVIFISICAISKDFQLILFCYCNFDHSIVSLLKESILRI